MTHPVPPARSSTTAARIAAFFSKLSDENRVVEKTPVWSSAFVRLRARLVAEERSDPEPAARFTPAWSQWQRRHLRRVGFLTELSEAEWLTTTREDPAPIASLGLAKFIAWAVRENERATARRRVRRPKGKRT